MIDRMSVEEYRTLIKGKGRWLEDIPYKEKAKREETKAEAFAQLCERVRKIVEEST
jgi:hypothetical protein